MKADKTPQTNFEYCRDPLETLRLLNEQTQVPLKNIDVSEMYEACKFDEKNYRVGSNTADNIISRMLPEAYEKEKSKLQGKLVNPTLYRHMINFKVNKKLAEVYKELGVEKYVQDKNLIRTLPVRQQKEIALKLCKYIVSTNTYEDQIGDLTQGEMYERGVSDVDALYYCLCEGRGICNDFAITLSKMLDDVGIESRVLIEIGEKGKANHAFVSLRIDAITYSLDPTVFIGHKIHPYLNCVANEELLQDAYFMQKYKDVKRSATSTHKYVFSEEEAQEVLKHKNIDQSLPSGQKFLKLKHELNETDKFVVFSENPSLEIHRYQKFLANEKIAYESQAEFVRGYEKSLFETTEKPLAADTSIALAYLEFKEEDAGGFSNIKTGIDLTNRRKGRKL